MHILVNPAPRRRTGRAAAETRNKPNLHQANALGAELAPDRGDLSCQDKEARNFVSRPVPNALYYIAVLAMN
jgi:hypothetical protein